MNETQTKNVTMTIYQIQECLAHHNPASLEMDITDQGLGKWIVAVPCGCYLDCDLFPSVEAAVRHWNERPYQTALVWLVRELMRQVRVEEMTEGMWERAERILAGKE